MTGAPTPCLTGLPEAFRPAVPLDRCFDARYGLEIVEDDLETGGGLRSRVRVAHGSMGPTGIVHGGVYAAVAEALAARATLKLVDGSARDAVGMANDTRFLRPIADGFVHSWAVVRHRDDRTWLWDVEHRDDAGNLCAVTRMTIAVR